MSAKIIDSHHHIWDRSKLEYDWLDAPEIGPIAGSFLLDDYDKVTSGSQISGSIVVQALEDVVETQWLLEESAGSDTVLGVVGWIDFAGDVDEQISVIGRTTGAGKFVGVRFMAQGFANPDEILDPKYQEGFTRYARHGKPLDVVCRQDQISAVMKLAQWHPDLTIILDHFGKPDLTSGGVAQWVNLIKKVGAIPNIAVKFSGLATEADWQNWTEQDLAPVMSATLVHVPAERLMFGSDWPVSTLAVDYDRWLNVVKDAISGLSETEQSNVLGNTALRLYRVDA